MQKINIIITFIFLIFVSCNRKTDQERVENIIFLANGNNGYFVDDQSKFVVVFQYGGQGWPDGSAIFAERIEVLDSERKIIKIARSENEIVTILVDGKQVRKPLPNEEFAALISKLK